MGLVCAFWGVFLVSLFVITLSNLLIMETSEEKSYELLIRLLDKDLLKKKAIKVMNSTFRVKQIKKRRPESKFFVTKRTKKNRQHKLEF